MSATQYIGARYVPVFADPAEWSSENSYEPLTIVLHNGNSYTSAQYVPVGIDIENDSYWKLTGNFNSQVEQYRSEVKTFDARITAADTTANDALSLAQTNEKDIAALDSEMAGTSDSGLKTLIENETSRASSAEKANSNAIAAETSRASTAEKVNSDAIAAEISRASIAENNNAFLIDTNKITPNSFMYPFFEMSKTDDYGFGVIPSGGIQGICGDSEYFYLGVNDNASDNTSTIYKIKKSDYSVNSNKIYHAQHVNSMCYLNGYIYISTTNTEGYGLIKVDASSFEVIAHSSTHCAGVCSDGNYLYLLGSTYLKRINLDFTNEITIKEYDDITTGATTDGINVPQGCTYYNNKLYFILSYGSRSATDTSIIRVTDTEGNLLDYLYPTFGGELEDMYYDSSTDRMFVSYNSGLYNTGGIAIYDITSTPYMKYLTRNYIQQYAPNEGYNPKNHYVIDYNNANYVFNGTFKTFETALNFAMQNKRIQLFEILSIESFRPTVTDIFFNGQIGTVSFNCDNATTQPPIYYPYRVSEFRAKNCLIYNNGLFSFTNGEFLNCTFRRDPNDGARAMFRSRQGINVVIENGIVDYKTNGGFCFSTTNANRIVFVSVKFIGDDSIVYNNSSTTFDTNVINTNTFDNFYSGLISLPFRRVMTTRTNATDVYFEGVESKSDGTYVVYRNTGGSAIVYKVTTEGLTYVKSLNSVTTVKIDSEGNITNV